MWLVRLALSNIYGVIVLASLIGVLGGVALYSIPVDILPSFKAPAVQVLTYYRGMPARSLERTITDRIERWVNQSPGVMNVESRSVAGVSVVKLYFQDDTDPSSALTMTTSLSLGALPYLPTNTLPPVVLPFDPTGTLPLGLLTVRNPNYTEAAVKDLARVDVRNMLGTIRGSVAPVVIGGKDRRVMIYLDPKKLESRRLSPVDVVRALDEGNLMVTPGTAYFGDNSVALESNVMVREVAELNKMPLKFGDGKQILLGDVGEAKDASVIQNSRVRINGERQVYIPVYRQSGSSSLAVAEGLKSKIPDMEGRLPEGTELEFVMDQTTSVRQAIDSLIEEGAIGVVLVSLMILIFLGNVRMMTIATMSIPLAILCGIVGLSMSGNSINVMTLAGLFLAIGPLVDNAIVVLENTHRHLAMGKNPYRAAFDGATELTLPVLVATLTTIIVLAPVAMMPGLGGFLFKPLAMAVAFAMIASFLLSWTFVPAMCSRLLKGHDHHTENAPKSTWQRIYGRIDRFLTAMNRGYGVILNAVLKRRLLVLGGVGLLFVSSLALFFGIGQEFFPQVDAGQISVQVRAPSNLRLDATERRIADVEKAIADVIPEEERSMVVSEIGLNPDWSAAYTRNAGQQDTVIRIQLTDERRFRSQQYAVMLREKLTNDSRFRDLEFTFDTGGIVSTALNYGAPSPIDIQIESRDTTKAIEFARKLRNEVKNVRGAADVRVHQRDDAPFLTINVDREKAAEVGLSARDVVMQVVTAMNSSIAMTRNFWIDPKSGNQYFVAVQYPEDENFRLEDLENLFATGTKHQGDPVRLSSLVTITPGNTLVELNHDGLRRVINVFVNTENRDIGGVATDIEALLKTIEVPEGIKIRLAGEYARMQESFSSLTFGLILATVLVYLLLVPLLRSFVSPFIILFTVPLGLIGVLVMLYTTGTTLNVQSEMGVIFLVGIVVSNGVLLLDFANKQRKAGMNVRDAVVTAAATRFRPIMMTFLATFLDLLPLAIGLGKGSESITPLARAVVGGLISATFLTLIVVPILYTLFIPDRPVVEVDLDKLLAEPPAPVNPHTNGHTEHHT